MEILLKRSGVELPRIVDKFMAHTHGEHATYCDLENALEEACRAQVKRVVEWMKPHEGCAPSEIDMHYCPVCQTHFSVGLTIEDMQALRKAAGGGE